MTAGTDNNNNKNREKMELEITQRVEKDIRWLEIDAGVRYWEDSEIDGVTDKDPEEDGEDPTMPFADKDPEGEWRWRLAIDINNGRIKDWPAGHTASIHYKVCDDGRYRLLDTENNTVMEGDDVYVPDCIGEYGDYIVMEIDQEGYIEDFSFTQHDLDGLADEWGYTRNDH